MLKNCNIDREVENDYENEKFLVEHYNYNYDGYEVCIYNYNGRPIIDIDVHNVVEDKASEYLQKIVKQVDGCTLPVSDSVVSASCKSTKLHIDYAPTINENISWDIINIYADSRYLITELTKFFVLFTILEK